MEFWEALQDIAKQKGISLRFLVQQIDHDRLNTESIYNLSSALRVFILGYYKTFQK